MPYSGGCLCVHMTSAIFLETQVNISSNTTQAELEASNDNLKIGLRMEFYLFPMREIEGSGQETIRSSRVGRDVTVYPTTYLFVQNNTMRFRLVLCH